MPQIAGFRGALWDPKVVELAKVAAEPLTHVKERLAKGELVRDATRAMYRYDQAYDIGGRVMTRTTLVCAIRLSPWSDGLIRPHEMTIRRRTMPRPQRSPRRARTASRCRGLSRSVARDRSADSHIDRDRPSPR